MAETESWKARKQAEADIALDAQKKVSDYARTSTAEGRAAAETAKRESAAGTVGQFETTLDTLHDRLGGVFKDTGKWGGPSGLRPHRVDTQVVDAVTKEVAPYVANVLAAGDLTPSEKIQLLQQLKNSSIWDTFTGHTAGMKRRLTSAEDAGVKELHTTMQMPIDNAIRRLRRQVRTEANKRATASQKP